ncbi:hypothetical protein Taro_008401, partial [Colocasia esculenta]|nr:hypothetical protein [Colocasia esculenta]
MPFQLGFCLVSLMFSCGWVWQCRQKTMDFSAACSNERRGKPCTIRFCHKCLRNRYGEKAEEVAAQEGWNCPKCRGICNCSLCMKKKGQQPTGILVHTARATGCSSVSEMLQLYQMRPEAKEMDGNANAVSANLPTPSKFYLIGCAFGALQQLVASERPQGKEKSRATSKVKRKLETKCQTSKPSEEKIEIVDVGKKGKNKISKLKGGNGNSIECNPRKDGTKENVVAKKKLKKDSGRCQKKDDAVDESGKLSTDHIGKEIPKIDGKTGCSGVMQVCDGSKEKGDLRKGVKEIKKSTKSKQMDIRKVLSDGTGKDVLTKKKKDGAEPEVSQKVRKEYKRALTAVGNSPDSAVVLPEATRLTTVAGIDLQVEDVGPALQFLEFCSAFGKVLGIKKAQPESVLRELSCGRGARRGQNSLIVQFFVKLLSRIQKQEGERSPSGAVNDGTWLKALKKCITESPCRFEGLPVDWIKKGAIGYILLDSSEKLRLLNFICDELLGTEEMRSWIDKENMGFIEERKEARDKVLSAKEEEKRLKKKLRDEVAEAMLQLRNGSPLTISEHNDLVAKIKIETEKAHSEVLGSLDVLRK